MTNELLQEILKDRPKNSSAKLSLEIRRHNEVYLADLIKGLDDEQAMIKITEHLISLEEVTYELRERMLSTSKIKNDILSKISNLHSKEFKKWDKEHPEKLVQEIQKTEAKKLTVFQKTVLQLRKLKWNDNLIKEALQSMNCKDIEGALSVHAESPK